jgi:hypothetical protein
MLLEEKETWEKVGEAGKTISLTYDFQNLFKAN